MGRPKPTTMPPRTEFCHAILRLQANPRLGGGSAFLSLPQGRLVNVSPDRADGRGGRKFRRRAAERGSANPQANAAERSQQSAIARRSMRTHLDEAERQCLLNLVSTPCTITPEGSSNVGTADCFRHRVEDLGRSARWRTIRACWPISTTSRPLSSATCNEPGLPIADTTCGYLLRQNSGHDGLSNAGRLHRLRNHAAGIAAQFFTGL